ncbi:MAG: HD domain-containing phosphohydrolase [Arcobacteraceae bacterium]
MQKLNKSINIVSIDDNQNNLLLIESICKELHFNITSFLDPLQALLYVVSHEIDMIVIDYMMPELNGIEFIKEYRTKNKTVPIVMVTAAGNDDKIHKEAFEVGVNDFLSKPVNSTIFKARVTNLLKLYESTLLLKNKAKLLEKEVQKATEIIIQREHETLKVLGRTAEYKDPETASHVSRVAHYSQLLAKEYGLSEEEQDLIFYASPFHDLGKVGIHDSILLKPSKLSEDEFFIMKDHAFMGYEILQDAKGKYLQAGATIAITHHERYNGQGYPHQLKGEEIHIFGRIVCIADVFDALTSERPYKKAWSFEEAISYLQKGSGTHFDPKLIDIFINNLTTVREIFVKFQ